MDIFKQFVFYISMFVLIIQLHHKHVNLKLCDRISLRFSFKILYFKYQGCIFRRSKTICMQTIEPFGILNRLFKEFVTY